MKCPKCGKEMELEKYINTARSFGEKGRIITEEWKCENYWKNCKTIVKFYEEKQNEIRNNCKQERMDIWSR